MKTVAVTFIFTIIGLGLSSCGPISAQELSTDCVTNCHLANLKASNKCSLDHPDSFIDLNNCDLEVGKKNQRCLGKCLGNL